ncbi:hypothetical protein PCANB_000731 [Pneumocystis canis]|nr:hypothetical protein PCK1_000637 [Pneumocystis canis]KAG5437694.1 hypothetical protein PCANB_000731 [Pneumocystis canis]
MDSKLTNKVSCDRCFMLCSVMCVLTCSVSIASGKPTATQTGRTYLDYCITLMPKDVKSRGVKKPTKKRMKKDPNAPKRGMSAYMFFAQENRELVKTENPDASFGQIGKILGELWKNLSSKDKQPYENRAKKDKERFETEKSQWRSENMDDTVQNDEE